MIITLHAAITISPLIFCVQLGRSWDWEGGVYSVAMYIPAVNLIYVFNEAGGIITHNALCVIYLVMQTIIDEGFESAPN